MAQPETNPTTRPVPGQPGGRTFPQKLAIYLTGVAIGLMLFGWFQYRKGLALQKEQAQQASPTDENAPNANAASAPGSASESAASPTATPNDGGG